MATQPTHEHKTVLYDSSHLVAFRKRPDSESHQVNFPDTSVLQSLCDVIFRARPFHGGYVGVAWCSTGS